jgi:hypothetical protein
MNNIFDMQYHKKLEEECGKEKIDYDAIEKMLDSKESMDKAHTLIKNSLKNIFKKIDF